jgi:hypothetical protein
VKRRGGTATIARGSCTVPSPAICSLHARLTRRGRAALKRSKQLRLTLLLTFKPRQGRALAGRTTVTVLR